MLNIMIFLIFIAGWGYKTPRIKY